MDDQEQQQLLESAVKSAEADSGAESLELAAALENYALFLRSRKLRTLDAANMKARADVIRSRHHQLEQLEPANPDSDSKTSVHSEAPQKIYVRQYVGNQSEAASKFQDDSLVMQQYNYYPTSQVWAPGSHGCGMFLLGCFLCPFWGLGILVFIFMLLVKPPGTLTVAYELRQPDPIVPEETATSKTCPKCAEQVKMAATICRFCRHTF